MKNNEPIPARRSTYNETPSEPAAMSADLAQTIAEARAEQVAALKAEIEKLKDNIAEVEARNTVQRKIIEEQTQTITEMRNAADAAENIEESPTATLVRLMNEHLSTYRGGPSAMLAQMERRKPVERAAYLAAIDGLARMLGENSYDLMQLASKSRTLEGVI